ncbi:MAG: M23 family metallopeptidase [bacterium]
MKRAAVCIVAVCLLLAAGVGTSAGADQLTPILMSILTPPSPVRGTDGLVYLQYELLLTSYSRGTFEVERIEVLDARTGRVVSDVSGAAVQTRLRSFGGEQRNAVLQPAQTAFALLFPTFRAMADVPRTLTHRVTLKPQRVSAILGRRVLLAGARIGVDPRPPLVLGPPLEGAGWYATGSCCLKVHAGAILPINGRLFIAQRYAIDWIRLDGRGRAYVGDPNLPASWLGYGARLLAVRSGTVVSVLDGLPERVPGQLPADTTLQNATGNHVVLDVGGGYFVFYAHMQPGSVRVKLGQRVRQGQMLGLLGNSGNTSAPHLHLHVMDSPSPLASQPRAYVFARVTVRGKVPLELSEDELADRGAPLLTAKRGVQHRVLPMHNWVVDFPPAR